MTKGAFAQAARTLIRNGYSPIPECNDKHHPMMKEWQKLALAPMTASNVSWFSLNRPLANASVAGGYLGLVPIDVDTDDPAIIAAIATALPRPNVAKKGSKGFTAFYRCADPVKGKKFLLPGKKVFVEILSTGKTTIPPSIHWKTGLPYRWLGNRSLLDTVAGDLVEITPAHLEALGGALAPFCEIKPVHPQATAQATQAVTDKRLAAYAQQTFANEISKLTSTSGGRNWQLFLTACNLGRFVAHHLLTESEVRISLVSACTVNGYTEKRGLVQVHKTISSGFAKSANDPFPVLKDLPQSGRFSRKASANTSKSPQTHTSA